MRAIVMIALLAGGAAMATGAQRMPAAEPPVVQGYLTTPAIDATRLLPPPPAEGSPAQAADRAAYEAAAAAIGSPAWMRASTQVSLRAPTVQAQLQCASGVRIDENRTPTLIRALRRAALDVNTVSERAKVHFKRPRPYAGDPAAQPCDSQARASLSPTYPSGHAAVGWLWGMMLAELAPDRATQLLAYGAELGDNRIVCRMHYPSDVIAGRQVGAAVLARLQAEPTFRADMAQAKAEVLAARAAGAPDCPGAP